MSNDEFKLLNNYLNRVFILLSRNDQFLINNIDLLDFFCQELSNALSDIDINFKSNENKITYLDVINISAEVIASIDSKYLKTFYKLISDGTIDFSYNNEYNYSHISLLNNQNTKLININRNFNYKSEYLISGSGNITNDNGFFVNTNNGSLKSLAIPRKAIEMDGRATIRGIKVTADSDSSGECHTDFIVQTTSDEGDYNVQNIPFVGALAFTSIDKIQAINANDANK